MGSVSWGQQLVQLQEKHASQQAYLALFMAPSRATVLLNVTRVSLPARTAACLSTAGLPCDFATTGSVKVRRSVV